MPSPGEYVCGPNATQNLFHDFEQTPKGDCGEGVECGEYVFNHRNASLLPFLLGASAGVHAAQHLNYVFPAHCISHLHAIFSHCLPHHSPLGSFRAIFLWCHWGW